MSSTKNPPSRKAQFCVPDEDCDSLSDGGSVQIVKSQVRAFSVPSSDSSPSSDEEEANIKSSESHHDAHKNPSEAAAPSLPSKNTNSTPNQPIEIWNDLTPQTLSHPINPKQTEFHDRLDNLDSTGASHFHPIDLEGSTSQKAMVTCNDSEDEGPEVFSSKRKSIPSTKSASPVLHSSSTPTPGFFKPRSPPSVMQDAEKCVETADNNSNEEEKKIGASEIHSQSASSEINMTNSSSGKLTGNSMDDLDSMDEDDFDSDDFSPRECSGNLNSSSQSSSFCGTGQMLSIASPYDFTPSDFANSSHREHQPILNHFKPQVSLHGVHGGGVHGGENVDDIREEFVFGGEKQVTCLLPNWTDRLSCNEKVIDVGQENLNDTHRAAQRPPSPSDAALAKKATSVDNLKHNWSFEGGSQVHPSLQRYREFPPEAASVDFTPTEPSRDSFFDGLDPGWTQCGDDRYSFRLQRELQRDNHSNIQPPLQRLNSFVADHDPRKYMTVAPWISTAAPFNQGGYTENRGFHVTKEDSICKYLAEAELQLPHKETESHPPRLNIADIVNPHADMSLGLKRKADEISSDEGERKALEESQISLVETSQVLPDAQPRENIISIETSVLEDSPDNTNKVSLHTSEPLEAFETDQPPKKKVKFSRPSAIGVGKFLSGVCVGIVGAFALFIATIPMAVREEALSDLTNSS